MFWCKFTATVSCIFSCLSIVNSSFARARCMGQTRSCNIEMLLSIQGAQESAAKRRPVWEDEDDEEVQVNIAGRNRLRKLRQTEEETVVTGIFSKYSLVFMVIYITCP